MDVGEGLGINMPPIPDFLRRLPAPMIEGQTMEADQLKLVEPQPPTAEEIMDTLRKLKAKRDKIDDMITGLKKQLITMVQKL